MDQNLIHALLTRRSLKPKYLTLPAPSAEELTLCARTALRAPVHGVGFPCRFVLVPEEKRDRLAGLLKQAAVDAGLDETAQAKAKSKARKGPQIVAFVVNDTVGVNRTESLLTAGAALEQFLLALKSLGYGAITLSGSVLANETVQAAFCKAPGEKLLGWLTVGTPVEGVSYEEETGEAPFGVWE